MATLLSVRKESWTLGRPRRWFVSCSPYTCICQLMHPWFVCFLWSQIWRKDPELDVFAPIKELEKQPCRTLQVAEELISRGGTCNEENWSHVYVYSLVRSDMPMYPSEWARAFVWHLNRVHCIRLLWALVKEVDSVKLINSVTVRWFPYT